MLFGLCRMTWWMRWRTLTLFPMRRSSTRSQQPSPTPLALAGTIQWSALLPSRARVVVLFSMARYLDMYQTPSNAVECT